MMSRREDSTLPDILAMDIYLRERLQPEVSDFSYLHLSDLRLALSEVATDAQIKMLDFGCGGSPYRALFPNAQYLRADLPGTQNLDYEISPDGRVAAPDASFDLVLSCQVLEHVASPSGYLAESLRVLKPGGRLVCTTHGTFEDHGCPYDYWRWTADGLRAELQAAGYQVNRMLKLTTGQRALLFLMERFKKWPRASAVTRFGLMRWILKLNLGSGHRSRLHKKCDRLLSHSRVVEAVPDSDPLYIALLVDAEKPAAQEINHR